MSQDIQVDSSHVIPHQKTWKITYDNYSLFTVPKKDWNSDHIEFVTTEEKLDQQTHFLVNDHWGFQYFSNPKFSDPYKKTEKPLIIDDVIHHACVIDFDQGLHYDEVAWPDLRNPYLIKDSLRNKSWQFYEETKTFLGKTCYAALHVTEKKDSLLVWFTGTYPVRNNIFNLQGIPGLVLYFHDQRTNRKYIARKIQETNFEIRMPKRGEIISIEDWRNRKK